MTRKDGSQKIKMYYPDKIISGGQTGVDRAGLDAAMEAGLPVGGYVPKGRLAEDGCVPDKYPMTETASTNYRVRTRRNVVKSDGTLIINSGELRGGTALTARLAREKNKPLMIVRLDLFCEPSEVIQWLKDNHIHTLNIAGPRESESPGIYMKAKDFLLKILFRKRR